MRKTLLALAGAVVMALVSAGPVAAAGAGHASPAVPTPVSLVITSVSPDVGTPHGTVTVSGYITDTTSVPLDGLMLQLWSSAAPFASRAGIDAYLGAAGAGGVDQPVAGAVSSISSLPAHATRQWSLRLKPAAVGMTGFGVYPLAVQASQGGVALFTGHARTLLPFDPGTSHQARQKLRLAWVWPLIDTPQQTACSGLLTDGLAGAIAPVGRLGRLLTDGAGPAGRQAQLTWAIDPSLLAGVSTMTGPYRVGASADCAGGSARPASTAARTWLRQVKAATSTADFFVTPYADVDVAALSHHGLDGELRSAFTSGRSVASAILGQAQRPSAPGASGGSGTTTGLGASTVPSTRTARSQPPLGAIAWPADGLADYGVLGSLAVNGVGTVILDGSMMPPSVPSPFTPSSVATTTTGVGTGLNVLLTDDGMDKILAGAPTATAPGGQVAGSPAPVAAAAAAFATGQQFLAETAMIVSEEPTTQRSIVIAPPRRWNPASGVAAKLLQETVTAPWVQPVSVASLARGKPGPGAVARRQPPQSQASGLELRPALLHQVRAVDAQINLQASILTPRPPDYLGPAVAAVESSAWRGSRAGMRSAQALLGRIQAYLAGQQKALQIVDPPRVTLGGKSGSVPVSIANHLRRSVRVLLQVSPLSKGRIVIGRFSRQVLVQPGEQRTIKIPVQSAVAGSTSLSVQLSAPDGTPLPGESATLTVDATHFGTLALVIIGIAFGVFVLASIARAIRRGGGRPGEDGPETPETVAESDETGINAPNPNGERARPDTVGADWPDHERAPEEADEHASTRGRADPR